MSNFILNANDDSRKIIELNLTQGYSFNPKNQVGKFSHIKTVSLYDPSRIENIIINKYTIRYHRLAKIFKDLVESDDTSEADFMICLDEIEKLKSILQIKYQAFLKKEMYDYFLNDLYFLQTVLEEKIIEYRNSLIMEMKGR
ncbi:MAG: hypothetical protein E7167_00105 [Firmicutes bacterium]|nr:hypothetical protein [Bacillota bacterium]